MKKIIVMMMCVFAAGCTATNRIVSSMQTNPLVVDIATRQAVFRYIDAGKSDEQKLARAERVTEALDSLEYFLEGNPTASSATLLLVVKDNIDLNRLDPGDRILVEDIFTIIEGTIVQHEQAGLLSQDAVIRIRVLIRTLVQTAESFKS